MALEFTAIPDREGPAVYLLGNGQSQTETALMELGAKIDSLTPDATQVVYLDPTTGDGLKIKEFYELTALPCVVIVMDDDTIHYKWDSSLPSPDDVAYFIRNVTGL